MRNINNEIMFESQAIIKKAIGLYFIMTAFLIGLHSCKTDCADDYEMKVLDEIFYNLIKISGAMDLLLPPPPSPYSESTPESIAEKQRMMDRIEKVNNGEITAVIAIVDSLFAGHKYVSFDDIKHCIHSTEFKEMDFSERYMEAFEAMENQATTSRFLDLSKIENKGVFTLKYESEFPQERNSFWEKENYNFYLSGLIGISRIYFDSSCQFGVIYCYGMCSPRWGSGQFVFICKIKDKWVIEKTMELWVA